MAEGDGTNGAAAKAGAAKDTKEVLPPAEVKAPEVDEADVLEEDDDFEEFEEDRTLSYRLRLLWGCGPGCVLRGSAIDGAGFPVWGGGRCGSLGSS